MHTSRVTYSFPNINYSVSKNKNEAYDIALIF